jgi:hypothetical protein
MITTKNALNGTLSILFVFVVFSIVASSSYAQNYAGAKGIPTSGYTQIAPGHYMQTRQGAGFYSLRINGNHYRSRVAPVKVNSATGTRSNGSLGSKMQRKSADRKKAMKARAAARKKSTSNRRFRLNSTRSLR